MPDSPIYCFISYSRRDTAVARWLQQHLEDFKYPAKLVEPERRPADPKRLRPVFLDSTDLPTSQGSFWEDICAKIDRSRYLLVLCSRASAASDYVNKEIAHFLKAGEGRLDQIILAIVDPDINLSSPAPEDFPSEIFRRWDRLSKRNHPLLFSKDGESQSANWRRGLMQIASFMLGVEWTVLYNRYLIARRKVLARAAALSISVLAAIVISLTWALWKQRELTKFEREVFPYSLVVGYVDNFLSPLLTSLDKRPEKPRILIAMPASYEELNHNQRVALYKERAAAAGYAAQFVKVETSLPRGAETAVITPTPPYYQERKMELYVDFASTVAAFRHVIDYKKSNSAYAHTSSNQMLLEYASEFEKSVQRELAQNHPGQQDRIIFVHSPEAALRVLAGEL